jgi:hypothetical protein
MTKSHEEPYGALLSIKDLRDIGSPPTIYKLIDQGELESFKVGKYRKVTERSRNALIARRIAESKSAEAA